jgi:hypothetical protein
MSCGIGPKWVKNDALDKKRIEIYYKNMDILTEEKIDNIKEYY